MSALSWFVFAAIVLALAAAAAFIFRRGYIARTDRTYMTHDEKGFKRALHGWGVVWSVLESVVKGTGAPRIDYVALDPATGKRRSASLLDPKSGSVSLRPQYCVPLPFFATTSDSHRMLVEARVQFSLNRDLMKYIYQLDDFGLALETRIQSAFRAEIGRRPDEVLRASLHEVEEKVIERLRQAERDGDEAGEPGVALGVNFHTTSFTYSTADDSMDPIAMSFAQEAPAGAGGDPASAAGVVQGMRTLAKSHGVLSLKAQQIDVLADVFKGRDPASTQALLAMMEMQTRQNIAEALAGSGQLIVLTAQELGLSSAVAQRDAMETAFGRPAPSLNAPNGAVAPRAG